MAVIGAILGDIAGSTLEFSRPKDFNPDTYVLFQENCYFTDDTVCTLAIKYAVQHRYNFSDALKWLCRCYPGAGYGTLFDSWIWTDEQFAYNSKGNGSAMRVSYIAEHYDKIEDVIKYARESAMCTHNHPEGIKGAEVTAVCIWMAKRGCTKKEILEYCNSEYPSCRYAWSAEYSLDEIVDEYSRTELCECSVPVAIRCFYESDSYEGFIRNVFKLSCDTDTICAIGGGIAEEYYRTTGFDCEKILREFLDDKLLDILDEPSR